MQTLPVIEVITTNKQDRHQMYRPMVEYRVPFCAPTKQRKTKMKQVVSIRNRLNRLWIERRNSIWYSVNEVMCRIGKIIHRGHVKGLHSHMVMVHTNFLIGTLRAIGVRRGMVV